MLIDANATSEPFGVPTLEVDEDEIPVAPPPLRVPLPRSSVVIDLIVHSAHEYSSQLDGWR